MTSGPHVAIRAWQALDPEERAETLDLMRRMHADETAGDETIAERMLRSIVSVLDYIGPMDVVSPNTYKAAEAELIAGGADIEKFTAISRHYGSWTGAKEAAALSPTTSARRIDSRFRSRRLGKIWRYTDESLRAAVLECSADLGGRAPRLSEFDVWRERKQEEAKAAHDDNFHLPSGAPYRKRFGGWEAALRWVGFTDEQVTGRFYQG